MDRFHFTSPPFTREFRIEHRLNVPFIEEEIKSLKETIDGRQSGVLIAPAGAGKTVVLRALRAMLPEARYRVSYIKLARLSVREMYRQLAMAVGIEPAGHYPKLVRAIDERIRSGFDGDGLRQVIIIDEAHDLQDEALRILRIITNHDMDSRLVVSIILSGQPPLKQVLLRPAMEDIRQRLFHSGELRLFSKEETKAYIDHRIKIAGAPRSPFDLQAVEALFEYSRGNMRAIDKLARGSLRVADRAGRGTVEAADVAMARAEQWNA